MVSHNCLDINQQYTVDDLLSGMFVIKVKPDS